MKQISLWEATERERTHRGNLQGDRTCEVVIIGGGFSGLSTAYHLQKITAKQLSLRKKRSAAGQVEEMGARS